MTKKFEFDYDSTTPSTVVGISKTEAKKKRNFPGAWTKRGFGQVNAPKVAGGGSLVSTIGYGTAGDPVTTPAGEAGALGEAKEEKFLVFLESLKSDVNLNLIEVVKKGFSIYLESEKTSKKH